MGLLARVGAGDLAALARLATYVENQEPLGLEAIERLYASTGRALTIGLTGPPGAGKSTLIDGLISTWRERGLRVGVIAIDPTSPLSGGATLGDRIRMRERPDDAGVFVRSMASRGRRGGLAPATAAMIHLLDAAGFDRVLVETVGVGQEEVEITRFVHLTVLLQIPGSGDGIQALKAGLLELADIYVVNKSDLPGADLLARELSGIAALSSSLDPKGEDAVPVVRVSAVNGDGIVNLVDAIERIGVRRRDASNLDRIARAELVAVMTESIRTRVEAATNRADIDRLVREVADRRQTPRRAAEEMLAALSR
ncbi:MAG: methylmalonyl Co-A mutase-associated GTPase MeaB [Thermomicrobiales bacterium]|nr:methylmalonyl Co-A mutase-associated GTPase MeaB [Thermomicrobiales bacterium]